MSSLDPRPSASNSHLPPITIKRILSPAHLAAFGRSNTHTQIIGFISTLNERILGKKISEAGEGSDVSWLKVSRQLIFAAYAGTSGDP